MKKDTYLPWEDWSFGQWLMIIMLSPTFWLGYVWAALGGDEDGFIPMILLGSLITSIILAILITR